MEGLRETVGCTTVFLAGARRPPTGPRLVLDGTRALLVNHVAPLSEVQPSYAPPGRHLLAAVITKLFSDRQVEVEPHVVQFLVRRIERSLSTAIDVVDRLDRAALEQKCRITRALATETVNALDRGQAELDL